MLKRLFIPLVLLLSMPPLAAQSASTDVKETPIEIGLIHFAPPLSKDMDFSSTLKHLQKVFYPRKVEAKIYSSADLEKAIKEGKIDFFYASSGFFWRMLPFGVRDIATVVTEEKPEPNFGTAGAFIMLRNGPKIRTLEEMKGKSLVANYATAFHGYRTGMAEIEKMGYDHEKFFSSIHFVGESAEKIIDELLKGKADIGYVRACWLEEFEHNNISVMDRIKVIAPRSGPIACLHSTRSYPNNTFAATHRVDSELARKVSIALLSMPPDPKRHNWSLATDFKPFDDLYKTLKIGPYEYLRYWSVERIWQQYWPLVILFCFAILALALYSWRAGLLVEKRNRQLVNEVRKRKELQAKAESLSEKMESQQKLNIVGQLSSMFAHEINQPLAACSYFIDGLKALSKRGSFNKEQINYSLDQISEQMDRASQIVSKVRQYAKSEATRSSLIDLSQVCADVCHSMEVRFQDQVHFVARINKDICVLGDLLECQLLVWNLMKNAAEAASEVGRSEVELDLISESNSVLLSVKNTGKKLSAEQIQSIQAGTLQSSKQGGLGIGLAIVHSITEAMGANLSIESSESGGLIVKIAIPLPSKENLNG